MNEGYFKITNNAINPNVPFTVFIKVPGFHTERMTDVKVESGLLRKFSVTRKDGVTEAIVPCYPEHHSCARKTDYSFAGRITGKKLSQHLYTVITETFQKDDVVDECDLLYTLCQCAMALQFLDNPCSKKYCNIMYAGDSDIKECIDDFKKAVVEDNVIKPELVDKLAHEYYKVLHSTHAMEVGDDYSATSLQALCGAIYGFCDYDEVSPLLGFAEAVERRLCTE